VRETFRRHATDDEDPRKRYGVGKVRCEDHLSDRHEQTGLPTTILRVGHTLGPHSPLPSRDPVFFARLEAGRPIPIPGEGFPFIHLVHVDDVACLMASVVGNVRAVGQVYNVAGGEITSIAGCVELMARAVGVRPDIVKVPIEVARDWPHPIVHWGEGLVGGAMYSIDKALSDLDWRPRFGLEDGYRDSYEWFRNEGRSQYEFDFTNDDALLERLR
jgi:nucleoside-diphosphate-sugar epimerase